MAITKIDVDQDKTYEVRIEGKGAKFIFKPLGSGSVYYRSSMVQYQTRLIHSSNKLNSMKARSHESNEAWVGDSLPYGVKFQLVEGNLDEDVVVILDIRVSQTQNTTAN